MVRIAETEVTFDAVIMAKQLRRDPGRAGLLDIVKKAAFIPQR